jgi:hypothetical protein
MLIQIAILIIVVVGVVHFVHKNAFNQGRKVGEEIGFLNGKEEGIEVGREQVLKENILRQSREQDVFEKEFKRLSKSLVHEYH